MRTKGCNMIIYVFSVCCGAALQLFISQSDMWGASYFKKNCTTLKAMAFKLYTYFFPLKKVDYTLFKMYHLKRNIFRYIHSDNLTLTIIGRQKKILPNGNTSLLTEIIINVSKSQMTLSAKSLMEQSASA